ELATKSILGLGSVRDDSLAAEIFNRLGIFCYSFLDYDRAAEQMEASLVAAERCGDRYKICRQLQNVADVLLLAVRVHVNRASVSAEQSPLTPEDRQRLRRAAQTLERLFAEATPEMLATFGSARLQAELLLESGEPAKALAAIKFSAGAGGAVADPQRSAFASVESRCLRALGRHAAAVQIAERAVQLALASDDDQELMLALEERLAARRAAGDLEGAIGDALDVKWRMWSIHERQTSQVAEHVWERAAIEQERRQLEETTAAAIRSAEEDALTRIGNRRLLERFLARAADKPTTLALVMADIDHFKEINDTYGHELGDLVMSALGQLFAAETRPGQVVVRYGGEEFVFAMPGAELMAVSRFAERVRLRVASYPWAQLDTRLAVTISLGVAAGPLETWRSVLAAADGALYLAKRRGRNRVEAATPELERTAG
ncbi:MAG TPA: GGDEF domain-containing protein, partial [Acidimicrobiales bacterium]|nr:GGDEF domain-containing protein [Acidimicrobiales bacterium]